MDRAVGAHGDDEVRGRSRPGTMTVPRTGGDGGGGGDVRDPEKDLRNR
jgi:hypothetical protein